MIHSKKTDEQAASLAAASNPETSSDLQGSGRKAVQKLSLVPSDDQKSNKNFLKTEASQLVNGAEPQRTSPRVATKMVFGPYSSIPVKGIYEPQPEPSTPDEQMMPQENEESMQTVEKVSQRAPSRETRQSQRAVMASQQQATSEQASQGMNTRSNARDVNGLSRGAFESDPSQVDSIPYCPEFHPTSEEFVDFSGYVEKCVKQIGTTGIFKVVPPKDWVARKAGYQNLKFHVKRPIEQNVQSTGSRGVYELTLIEMVSRALERFEHETERCERITDGKSVEQIEQLFWKSLVNNAPLYGADVSGSLFDENIPWNLRELDTLLTKGMRGQNILGVTQPYVYVGSWKSMFGWHKEDMDLYSINYLHHGKPKFWYSIDLRHNERFESFMQSKFPENYKRCKEFIRHKTTLVHPKVLLQQGFKMTKAVHRQGEFIISRAAAYHSGFNFGFNIAEAVNFAVSDWLKIARNVSYCKCVNFSVKLDFDDFMRNLKGLPPKDDKQADKKVQQQRVILKQTSAPAAATQRKVMAGVQSKIKAVKCAINQKSSHSQQLNQTTVNSVNYSKRDKDALNVIKQIDQKHKTERDRFWAQLNYILNEKQLSVDKFDSQDPLKDILTMRMPRLRTSSQTVATVKKERQPKLSMSSLNKKLNEAVMRIDYDKRIPAASPRNGTTRVTNMTQKKKINKQLSMLNKMHKTLETLTKKVNKEKAAGTVRKNQKKQQQVARVLNIKAAKKSK